MFAAHWQQAASGTHRWIIETTLGGPTVALAKLSVASNLPTCRIRTVAARSCLGLANPATPLETPTLALNRPAHRACLCCRSTFVFMEHSMATAPAQATRAATPAAQPVQRRVFHLVCGYCGGNIAVEGGTPAHQVRCPRCLHRVEVVQFVSHACEDCGALSRVDLTSGVVVGNCDCCGKSYTVGPIVAPALRRHRSGKRRSHPPGGTDPAWAAAFTLLAAGGVVLFVLATLFAGWLGSGG